MSALFLFVGVYFMVIIYFDMAFLWLIVWTLGYFFDKFTFDEYWLLG